MEQKIFRTGDPVTAEFMTELSQTVVTAETNAAAAKAAAEEVKQSATDGEFNGKSVHIRFSASATGENSSETWTSGKDYIGIAISSDAVVPLSAYKWIRFVGEKGADFSLEGTTLHITVK